MRRDALAAVMAAVAVLSLPAAAASARETPNVTHSIHGTAWTTPTIIGTCPDPLPPGPPPVVSIQVAVGGTAVISRLGRSAVTIQETALGVCVGAPVPAPIALLGASGTYTAANGDQLDFVTLSATPIEPVPGTPLFRFTSVDQFTPTGAGRFATATGTAATVVTFDPTATPISATFTFTGTITVPRG